MPLLFCPVWSLNQLDGATLGDGSSLISPPIQMQFPLKALSQTKLQLCSMGTLGAL